MPVFKGLRHLMKTGMQQALVLLAVAAGRSRIVGWCSCALAVLLFCLLADAAIVLGLCGSGGRLASATERQLIAVHVDAHLLSAAQ